MGAAQDYQGLSAISNDAQPAGSTPTAAPQKNVTGSDAERLGAYWLERHRRVDGPGQLPSEEPLNELLLGLDYFRDLSEESPTALTRAQLVAENSEQVEASENEKVQLELKRSCDAAAADGEHSISSGIEHLRPIPTSISNEREYVGHFLPLFLQEAKQSILRAAKLDMPPPEEFVQVGGEPCGRFLSLTLERTSPSAASAGGCRYCHNDLLLLYLPTTEAQQAEQAQVQQQQKEAEGGDDSVAAGEESTHFQPVLQEGHVKCHMLAVAHQSTQDGIIVRVLTPSLDEQRSCPSSDGFSCFNVATGRPDGHYDERDRKRMVALAEALNAHLTRWRVCRIMALTTLHREFQGLMSLPDVPLKDCLFFIPSEESLAEARALAKADAARARACAPFQNPLVEDLSQNSVTGSSNGNESQQLEPDSACEQPQENVEGDRRTSMEEDGATAEVDSSASGNAEAGTPASASPKKRRVEENMHLVIPDALHERLASLYNASQLAALRESLKVRGVTLIQGPPGTGKTSTIVGVLSVILHSQLQAQAKASREALQALGSSAPVTSADAPSRKHRPWLLPAYEPWMDAEEFSLEDFDCTVTLLPAAVATEPPLELKRERDEFQPGRVLVCAPSNAAIDEILKRLTADPSSGGGIFDGTGKRFSPTVVRVGPNIHPDLLQYSLQYKALQRLKAKGATNLSALAAVKAAILRESSIVCATLSVCGSRDLTSLAEGFDTVVIDEASQAVELSTLIPLRLGCRRLILVGDPKQLPATIFSRVAIQLSYDRSLFQRLESAGYPKNMLSVQYRMHPSISLFASNCFYSRMLRDAPHLPSGLSTPFPNWHRIPIFQPLVFFNLDSQHTEEHTSLVNLAEASFVCQLVDFLRRILAATGNTRWEGRLAVISPYAQQVRLLRRSLKTLLGVHETKACPIDVNTVDGFQRVRENLDEHAPGFLDSLRELQKRRQRQGRGGDEENVEELQTEGPVEWEEPLLEDEPEAQNMETFHDITDEGCLDDVAIQQRDEALREAEVTAVSTEKGKQNDPVVSSTQSKQCG